MIKHSGFGILFIIFAGLLGCSGASEPEVPGILTIKISPVAPTIKVGASVQMKIDLITVSTSEGVIWRTGNPNIATITSDGLITGVGAGKTSVSLRAVSDTMAVATTPITVE